MFKLLTLISTISSFELAFQSSSPDCFYCSSQQGLVNHTIDTFGSVPVNHIVDRCADICKDNSQISISSEDDCNSMLFTRDRFSFDEYS